MYSDKKNINILTALLVAHGIRDVVVCPGSRNAPLTHNFNVCPDLRCHALTDERCAGFFALGLSQATNRVVAVCVTSGTAMLNVAPAVAEATYQRQGIVVITADRPEAWIDQQDGQTLRQSGAFGSNVACSMDISEPTDEESEWFVNRKINEALLAAKGEGRPSVHINVPISEPLFEFNTPSLPECRVIKEIISDCASPYMFPLRQLLSAARRPMIVIGQTDVPLTPIVEELRQMMPVVGESLALQNPMPVDKILADIGDQSPSPDLVFYTGGTLVSKRIKQYLRRCADATFVEITPDGSIHDTFQHLSFVWKSDIISALLAIRKEMAFITERETAAGEKLDSEEISVAEERNRWLLYWDNLTTRAREEVEAYLPPYSSMMAVKLLEETVAQAEQAVQSQAQQSQESQVQQSQESQVQQKCQDQQGRVAFHYANSSPVRLGNLFSLHKNYCNRGVNGIEGSLSTAMGFAAAVKIACSDVKNKQTSICNKVFCVIGDLSFFYDSNALWQNSDIPLRVLLLNNGGGAIFRGLKGLQQSEVADTMVAGSHHTTAEGLCQSFGARYLSAVDEESLRQQMSLFVDATDDCPVVFEVFTDAATDQNALDELISGKKN